jgi:hypothetical protein
MEVIASAALPFGLVIFFILDLIAMVFDIFVITSPLGVFVTFLSTLTYILYTFMVYGKIKGTSKLFDFKKNFKQKAFKKIGKKAFKLIGGSTIPFVNVWAIWDDYREAKKEEEAKKQQLRIEIEEKQAENKMRQQEIEEYQKIEKGAIEKENEEVEKASQNSKENQYEEERVNPWIVGNKSRGRDIARRGKTIQEEVSGIKTGMSREDYDEGIVDYSKKETYDKLVLENEEKGKKEMRERQDIERTRSAKKKQEETEKKNAYDKEFIRRFGLSAYSRMNRDRESKNPKKGDEDVDKYREAA